MNHQHKWVKLLAEDGKKIVATSLFTCLKCGLLKIGERTIRISKYRLDMGDLPIKGIKVATFKAETNNGNSGDSAQIDWEAGQKQNITLTPTTNCTLSFVSLLGPRNLVLRLIQGSGGSKTVTWPVAIKWSGGTAPTLSATAGDVDIVSFYWDGTDTYYGVANTNFS